MKKANELADIHQNGENCSMLGAFYSGAYTRVLEALLSGY